MHHKFMQKRSHFCSWAGNLFVTIVLSMFTTMKNYAPLLSLEFGVDSRGTVREGVARGSQNPRAKLDGGRSSSLDVYFYALVPVLVYGLGSAFGLCVFVVEGVVKLRWSMDTLIALHTSTLEAYCVLVAYELGHRIATLIQCCVKQKQTSTPLWVPIEPILIPTNASRKWPVPYRIIAWVTGHNQSKLKTVCVWW